ncbi:ADP-ribosylation factor GTPase activating protein [Trypanosoma grayi]|uniref:ADP-ribosylation factor GTPase activating protein n=1 Tax=Trypanosoma grayi TaxID=71804 RepID=UPI0004F411BF|nr:ADP-ribosylation factor GTPase activating protein [Trypanosoma grayi]KEG11809.1 ADP-ribosylation factor GTPase activating protein [Trypanosoma grayi]
MSRVTAGQQQRLEYLLRKPENRECFECSAKQPRWASTNLGVFVCLRCAGLHRAMGTHVSKVRSTTMDTWEEDMIRCCECIGNEHGRSLYEHRMSPNLRPSPTTDNATVERFVRDKYERRMYYHPQQEELMKQFMAEVAESAWSGFVEPTSTLQPPPPATTESSSSSMAVPMLWGGDSTTAGNAPAVSVKARGGIDIDDLFSTTTPGPPPQPSTTIATQQHQLYPHCHPHHQHYALWVHTAGAGAMGSNHQCASSVASHPGHQVTAVDAKTEVMSLFAAPPTQQSPHVYSAWQPIQPSNGSYISP